MSCALRNVNEMRNARPVHKRACRCSAQCSKSPRAIAMSMVAYEDPETPTLSYPAEEEAEGKDHRRKRRGERARNVDSCRGSITKTRKGKEYQ